MGNSAAPGNSSTHFQSDASFLVNAPDDGEKIYLDKCARCHGRAGEGTEEYGEQLSGDLPIDELAEYIEATMPADKPEDCTAEEALQVAQYIHRSFYATQTRATLESTEIKFSRLTTQQFKQSLADLVGSFDHAPWHPSDRGLKAQYFASRHWNDKRKLAEQVDGTIDYPDEVPYFDPTGEYPHLEKIKAENKMGEGFSVYWSGAILAPQTGWYTFKIQSKNGFQLFINHSGQPLIDRKVRSDDVVDHTARIYLLAGRAYPLKLDFFSYPDPPAKIQLKWVPPMGVEEIVPRQYLIPHSVGESLAVSTTFPADDGSSGYLRGSSISREWDAAVTSSAIEAAEWVTERLFHYAKTSANADDRIEKVKGFCRRFAETAFSKSLSQDELQFFIDQHFENDLALNEQVKQVVILAIKSPRFLYPDSESRDPNFAIARQLALVIWDSLPDRELLEKASTGELIKPDIVNQQLYRMMDDPRAKAKLNLFFAEWLNLDKSMNVAKDPEKFANFNEQLIVDNRRSLEKFFDELIDSEQADVRQVYNAKYLYANHRLTMFYGWAWPESAGLSAKPSDPNDALGVTAESDAEGKLRLGPVPVNDLDEFIKITPADGRHAGIITHPYLMSGMAYFQHSSPIHRGVFVARKLLGRTLKQPNENFEPLTEDFDPTMTTRQRVEFQTKDKTCMVCHGVINPLGFSLENFDAVGRFRTAEKERPVDTMVTYKTPTGEVVPLNNALDLARFLAEDEGAKRNFVRQFFQIYVRQPIEAYGPESLDIVFKDFDHHQCNLRNLVMVVAKTTVQQHLPAIETQEKQ
jgi:hypothetical protein